MEISAVSVIIPMHNAEKYIGECLESLLAQTQKRIAKSENEIKRLNGIN